MHFSFCILRLKSALKHFFSTGRKSLLTWACLHHNSDLVQINEDIRFQEYRLYEKKCITRVCRCSRRTVLVDQEEKIVCLQSFETCGFHGYHRPLLLRTWAKVKVGISKQSFQFQVKCHCIYPVCYIDQIIKYRSSY